MSNHFDKVQTYLLDLDYSIDHKKPEEGIFIVSDLSAGIQNLFIVCADPILIIEQFLFELKLEDVNILRNLLMKSRDIVHGAFVLDETGKRVIFRDTLQLENLDSNELEASINSLALVLGEYSDELIKFSKH